MRWFVPLLALSCLLVARPARACSTCVVGDPTLTVMGADAPFAGRTRLSLAVRRARHRAGRWDRDAVAVREQRMELAAAYTPHPRLTLSLMVPLVRRHLAYANLARESFWSLGDTEVRGRVIVFRDAAFAPKHLLSLVLGLELPTAPRRRKDGVLLGPEAQSGSGSFDPVFGLGYAFFAVPWSLYLSSTIRATSADARGNRLGRQWTQAATVQLQPWSTFGVRVGLDARYETQGYEAGQRDPDSGGFVAFVSPGLITQPLDDLLVHLTVSVPVLERWRGAQDEGWALTAGVTGDL